MPVSKRNVVGIAVDVSLLKKTEANFEELLQKRMAALRLLSHEKKFSEMMETGLLEILRNTPLFYLRSKDATIDIGRDSASLRIPVGAPPRSKVPEKEMLSPTQISKISSDFNIVLGVFFSTLGLPIEKVRRKISVYLSQKSPQFQLVKAVDQQLFVLLQKRVGIDSITGLTFLRKAAPEKGLFECSVRHRVDRGMIEVVAHTEDDLALFTIDLEAIIAQAVNEANSVLSVFESSANG